MFSKKITNNENDIFSTSDDAHNNTDKISKTKRTWFRNYKRNHSDPLDKKNRTWSIANRLLLKKSKIIITTIILLNFASFIGLQLMGEFQKSKYKINYIQNLTLIDLSKYAENTIPLFNHYTTNTPVVISQNAIDSINDVVKYLVLFEYIANDNLKNTNFTIINFNKWVQLYQQWPQHSPDVNELKTKNKYISTLDTLVYHLTDNSAKAELLADMNTMLGFAQTLRGIDMNVYATFSWYNDARNYSIYSIIPIAVNFIVILGIPFFIHFKEKIWFRKRPYATRDSEENTAE